MSFILEYSEYSALGHILREEDVTDAVEIVVKTSPEYRQDRLPFNDGRPGRNFMRNVKARHGHVVSYSRPLRQESIRYESTNGENLTAHFVAVEAIIEEHNLDLSRIANLDETVITQSRDCARVSGARAFLSSTNGWQEQLPSFKNIDRVTIMPVIFAD